MYTSSALDAEGFFSVCGSSVGIMTFPKQKYILVGPVQDIPLHIGKISINTACNTEDEILSYTGQEFTWVDFYPLLSKGMQMFEAVVVFLYP